MPCFLGQPVQSAGSGQILVGVGLALAHVVELAHHQLFHVGVQCGETAGNGHIVGNHQFVQLCLVYIGIQVILNSNLFHDYLPYNKVAMIEIILLVITQSEKNVNRKVVIAEGIR